MEKKEFDLFELIRLLLVNRIFILVFVGLVGIGAVIFSLLTPQIWSSSASFYAVGESGSALPFDIPGLGGLTSKFLNTGGGDQSISFMTAMNSRGFSEDVIRKFRLISYFEITKPDSLAAMDAALKKLHKNMVKLNFDEESGLIQLRVESKSKKLSRDIAAFYLEHLERYNREQKITKGKMNREFLESRVNETRATIDSLMITLKDFQSQNKAVNLEEQSKALIESYSAVIAEKMKLDLEYELAKKNLSPDSPALAELETRRSGMAQQIKEMETSSSGLKPQYLVDISKLPDLGSQYAQIKMNLEIQSLVYQYLYPQYEAAKLDELKDMPTLDILDTPREAGLRVRPRRAIICIAAVMIAFVFASLIVIIKGILDNNKDRIKEIRESL
ncbi:MAG TPA: Wzz/FepE/Etk N-terminal domain-containing protein [Candidatus Cloacimonadota bacterium]|nr:Wzz/FepE/Etk N-terminal domain-containing protein [Candidatus Cloacimonadota bacterium]